MNTDWNSREEDVPPYELPELLAQADGSPLTTAAQWHERRRELLECFCREIYGVIPDEPVSVSVEDEDVRAWLDGAARLQQATLVFRSRHGEARVQVLAVIPAKTPPAGAPVFLGINFWGNHTIAVEEEVRMPEPAPGMVWHERGSKAARWPFRQLVDDGFAVVTAWRGQIAPDNVEHWREGVARLFDPAALPGAISLWAWTLSRLLDYAEKIPGIDARRATAVGHSRLGKTALWAAAQDLRFASAISNDSGCFGASLSRRRFGETVDVIYQRFPYWFTSRVAAYCGREHALPVDQHQLLALIAPRPLYVASATEDLWADPRGEYLATREAARLYPLLLSEPSATAFPAEMPAPDTPVVIGRVGYHVRTGPHDMTPSDWRFFTRFLTSVTSPVATPPAAGGS